jgi:hypothetical protein
MKYYYMRMAKNGALATIHEKLPTKIPRNFASTMQQGIWSALPTFNL